MKCSESTQQLVRNAAQYALKDVALFAVAAHGVLGAKARDSVGRPGKVALFGPRRRHLRVSFACILNVNFVIRPAHSLLFFTSSPPPFHSHLPCTYFAQLTLIDVHILSHSLDLHTHINRFALPASTHPSTQRLWRCVQGFWSGWTSGCQDPALFLPPTTGL